MDVNRGGKQFMVTFKRLPRPERTLQPVMTAPVGSPSDWNCPALLAWVVSLRRSDRAALGVAATGTAGVGAVLATLAWSAACADDFSVEAVQVDTLAGGESS